MSRRRVATASEDSSERASGTARDRRVGSAKRARGDANEGERGRGVSWLHLFFFALFFLPAAFAVVDWLFGLTPPDGQAYGTLSPEAKFFREKIRAFYSEYNPEKLGSVDGLLVKHKGKERALYNTIVRKYKKSNARRVDQRYDD